VTRRSSRPKPPPHLPVKVVIVTPKGGHGHRLSERLQWLNDTFGHENWWQGSAVVKFGDGSAYYFRTEEDRDRFLAEFPEVVVSG